MSQKRQKNHVANPNKKLSTLKYESQSFSLCWSANPIWQDITTVVMGAARVVYSWVLQQSNLRQHTRVSGHAVTLDRKKSTRPFTMKTLAAISPNSLKTIRVFKDEVYSYQILSFDLALCNEKSLFQVLQVFLMWHDDKAFWESIENDLSRRNHQLMLLSMWTEYSK